MDGGDDRERRSLRKSHGNCNGKAASNVDPSDKVMHAITLAGLSMAMIRRAALVPGRDRHVGNHPNRIPVVGDRVWAEFSTSSRANYFMYPATVNGVEFDGNGRVSSVHVAWWNRYRNHTHRNARQVYFRNEEAPGDFPAADEVFTEVFDDIVEEQNYQLSISNAGSLQPQPEPIAEAEEIAEPEPQEIAEAEEIVRPEPIAAQVLPTDRVLDVPNTTNVYVTDNIEHLRAQLEMTTRHLAETRESLATALAHTHVWRDMPGVVGIASNVAFPRAPRMSAATAERLRLQREGGVVGVVGIASNVAFPRAPRMVSAAMAERLRIQREGGVASTSSGSTANSNGGSASSSVRSGYAADHVIVNDAVGGAAGGTAAVNPVVMPAPQATVLVRTIFGRVVYPRVFYAPASNMTERPRDWYGGPRPMAGGGNGASP